MKIQIGHSQNIDYINELYEPIRKSELIKEHSFIFPHDGNISIKSEDTLKNVDLFVTEVSDCAIGLGIEIGFAYLYKKPIICFYKKGIKVSGSLKYVTDNVIEYENTTDLINKIEKYINTIQG